MMSAITRYVADLGRAIVLLVAVVCWGGGTFQVYQGISDFKFLHTTDRESLHICLDNPQMDCDPRRWKVMLFSGATFFVLGAVLTTIVGRQLLRGRNR